MQNLTIFELKTISGGSDAGDCSQFIGDDHAICLLEERAEQQQKKMQKDMQKYMQSQSNLYNNELKPCHETGYVMFGKEPLCRCRDGVRNSYDKSCK